MLNNQFLRRIVLLTVFIVTGIFFCAFANTAVVLNHPEPFNISPFFEYYRALEMSRSPKDIQTKVFTPYQKAGIHVEFSDYTYWFRVNVQAPQSSDWVLDCSNPLIEKIDFYIIENNSKLTYKHLCGGCFTEPNKRDYVTENPNFKFSLKKNTPQILLIRIQSQRGFYAKFLLMPEKVFDENLRKNERYKWIFEGMMILVDLCVLMIAFFLIRNVTFKIFALHSCLTTIIVLSYHESFGGFLMNFPVYASLINFLPYRLLPFSCILVTLYLLPIKTAYPTWVKWFLYANLLSAVSLMVALTVNYHWLTLKIIVANTLITELFIVFLFINALIKKIYFDNLIAFTFFLSFFGFIFLQLRLLQFIDYEWVNPFLYCCEIYKVIFFVLLIYRVIKNYEKERVLATQLLLNNQLINNENELLKFNQSIPIQSLDLIESLKRQLSNFNIQNPQIKVEFYRNAEECIGYINEEKFGKIISIILTKCLTNEVRTIICEFNYNTETGMIEVQIEGTPNIKNENTVGTKNNSSSKPETKLWLDYDKKRNGYYILKELAFALRSKLEFSEGVLSSKKFRLTIPISLQFWNTLSETGKEINIVNPNIYTTADELLNEINLIELNDTLLSEDIVPNEGDKAFIQKVESIIEHNLMNSSFAISDLAEELNMSTVQLRRKVKAITNQTTVEYIRNFRLKKAAELLKLRSGNISDVAFQVGFESLSYFTKVFQEYYGKSPSDWAKQIK